MCGSGPLQCCVTGSLNHLFGNDFKPGESNHFEGSFLGECDGFDLGESNTINMNNVIEIYHDGMYLSNISRIWVETCRIKLKKQNEFAKTIIFIFRNGWWEI